MFRFALDDDLTAASPVVGVSGLSPEHAPDRVLTADEIRKLRAKFSALDPALRTFFKLRLMTAQRGIEIASM